MSQRESESGRESPPSTPLWVKVFGIMFIVLIALFVTLHLTGHSPMNHTSHTGQEVKQP